MSEHQYYEFQAIDRPLDAADQAALRALSTRAQISATSFVNDYQWGDFKGDPQKLMELWFDLHLYWANWGSRRLMIRVPKRLIDQASLDAFLLEVDCVTVKVAGESLIFDINADTEEGGDDWNEYGGALAALAPLRVDLMSGDLRALYMLWLTAVAANVFEPDEAEPLSGIGPLTGPLQALANFLYLDPDLVAAAAERDDAAAAVVAPPDTIRRIVAGFGDAHKTDLLVRLSQGDMAIAAELRAEIRKSLAAQVGAASLAPRTVGELRARAEALRQARKAAAAEQAAAERRRAAEAEAAARQKRFEALQRRGEVVWKTIEDEIDKRNVAGYEQAVGLLSDLEAFAAARGTTADFLRHLTEIRQRHSRKHGFIARIAHLGQSALK